MKKTLLIIAILFSVCYNLNAQVGSSCSNPNIISSLPFSQQGLTTSNLFNYYTSAHACGSAYMSGKDYVFTYTPPADQNVILSAANTGNFVGLFVTNNCPDAAGVHCIAKMESQNGNPQLVDVQLHADSIYYIIVSTNNLFNLNPSTNFDFDMRLSFHLDAGMTEIAWPQSSCGLSDYTYFYVRIFNYGTDSISDFDYVFTVDDGPEMLNHIYDTIPPNDFFFIATNQYADLSVPGHTYKIKLYTKLAGDMYQTNDTAVEYLTNCININSFPYNESFENGSGGWITEWKDSRYPYSTWQLGTPADSELDHAASGVNAWKTNLTGQYHPFEFSYILSPCFNLSSLSQPWIEMNIWYKLNSMDIVTVEYSTNDGLNWYRLGNSNEGTNWYNVPPGITTVGWHGESQTWLNAKHALTGLGGQTKVQLKVIIEAGSNLTNEGFAVDDIKIYEAPLKNIGVYEISQPLSECGLSNTDTVKIKIINYGLEAQSNFNVAYSVNSGPLISELISGTIHPQDTIIYTFTQTVDLSLPGSYAIMAKTMLVADLDTTNDQRTVTIINYPVQSSFPYSLDFETNGGDWFVSGINPSWEWGVPTGSVINHAASGTHVWETNLAGSCNEGEDSFLTGSCFDFTDMKNPYVKFKVWYESTGLGTQFETSVNGGLSWQNLGAVADSNWYNIGHNWTGNSGDWVAVYHNLHNFIDMNNVQFRFEFTSLIHTAGFALDDFQVCDAPVAGFTYTTAWPQVSFYCSSVNATTYHWDFGDDSVSTSANPVHNFTNDTNYVTLIVGNDCNTNTIVQILVCPPPAADFTYTINWHEVTFHCTDTNAVSYFWDFNDGNTSVLQNPVHVFLNDTNYVTLTVFNSCNSVTVSHTIILSGIDDVYMNSVKIFPNPAKSEVNIRVSDAAGSIAIDMKNIHGVNVYYESIAGNEVSRRIDLKNLSKGIYYLRVQTGKFVVTKKLVLQ